MIKVEYSEDRKHAYFNGETFTRDNKTGYYLTSNNGKYKGRRLHRAVWEYYNGEIPDGYDVHHIDHDKNNNDIENLRLMKREDHRLLHRRELTDEQREFRHNNMIEKAIPAAADWHRSEEGRGWHKQHYERTKDKLHEMRRFKCEYCGKRYKAEYSGQNRFCSNVCKSAWRRKAGLDDVKRICVVCGNEFTVNKYTKTKTCSRKCAGIIRRGNSA